MQSSTTLALIRFQSLNVLSNHGGGGAHWALEVMQAVLKSGFKRILDIFVDFMNILTIYLREGFEEKN